MSKTKTKVARRQLKRDGQRQIAAHQKKLAQVAAAKSAKPPLSAKKQKQRLRLKEEKERENEKEGKERENEKEDEKETANEPQTVTAETPAPKPTLQASQKHAVPFGPYDHILLVGEGDFSFTRSLVEAHGCANVTATSFDSQDQVHAKYPSFAATQTFLADLTPPVPLHHNIDAARLSSYKALRCQREDDDVDNDDAVSGWDTIAFLFPHVGGLSTHVNRQVRSNQALLVSFFKSCLETSTPKQRLRLLEAQANAPNLVQRRRAEFLRTGGRIMLALFEGEPYSLWNVRDLARHAGLKVVESYRFDWDAYPGYAHVRTLGAIEGGGAWRGDEREARMYVFEKVALQADSDEERELERAGVKLRKRRVAGEKVVRKKRKLGEDEDSE